MNNILAPLINNPIIYDYYQEGLVSKLYLNEAYSLHVLKKEQPNISNKELIHSIERISIHSIIHLMMEENMLETIFSCFKEYLVSSLTNSEHLIFTDYIGNNVFHCDIKYSIDSADRVEKYRTLQELLDLLLKKKEYSEYYTLDILDSSNKNNTKVRELLKLC